MVFLLSMSVSVLVNNNLLCTLLSSSLSHVSRGSTLRCNVTFITLQELKLGLYTNVHVRRRRPVVLNWLKPSHNQIIQ